VYQSSDGAAEDEEAGVAPAPHRGLDRTAEDPEEEQVAEQVQPAAVEEERAQQTDRLARRGEVAAQQRRQRGGHQRPARDRRGLGGGWQTDQREEGEQLDEQQSDGDDRQDAAAFPLAAPLTVAERNHAATP